MILIRAGVSSSGKHHLSEMHMSDVRVYGAMGASSLDGALGDNLFPRTRPITTIEQGVIMRCVERFD